MLSFLNKLFCKPNPESLKVEVTVRVIFENSPNFIQKIDKETPITPSTPLSSIKQEQPQSKSYDYDLGEPMMIKNLGKEI